MNENTSGLMPLGRAVMIKPYEPEIAAGLIQLPDSVKATGLMLEQRAIVVAVGECAWDDEKVPRAKPGDKVIVTKFAGYMAVGPKDGLQYRLVNDRDIFARMTEEVSA
jgi:co-chaperonin GroES (HSP10)